MKNQKYVRIIGMLFLATVYVGVRSFAGTGVRDNDDFNIAEPEEDEAGDYIWSDGAYLMSIYQMEKPLDIGWYLRKTHLMSREEAENVDFFDEVLDSTWFTNRHGRKRMTPEELARGPSTDPPFGVRWTVIKGKTLGQNPGFVVKDERGKKLFIKFDQPNYPGMSSNGDVIISKFMHAAGYNVPAYYQVWISSSDLTLSSKAVINGKYKVRRAMTRADLDGIFAKAPKDHQGRALAEVSVVLPGKTKGSFNYLGLREDDPNDTVRHENRRELRGLRVLSAWANNIDVRRGNTLDMYVEEDGRGFLRHYNMDLSASFGSADLQPKESQEGHEYLFDPDIVSQSFGALGLWLKPWERAKPVAYPEIGRFDADTFEPAKWRNTYPNPAFDKMTARDAFWGAKIVTAFTDEDIRAVVHTGYFPTPGAEDYLVRVLIERRDKIGRYWMDSRKINPLDDFAVASLADGKVELLFHDLSLERGYADKTATLYRYRLEHDVFNETQAQRIEIPRIRSAAKIEIQTSRDSGKTWGRPVRLRLDADEAGPRLAGILR